MATVNIRSFQPVGDTVSLAVGTGTSNIAVTRNGMGLQAVRLFNDGNEKIYVRFGDSTVTAAVATGIPMLPNSIEVFSFQREQTHIAAIAGAPGNTLRVTTGEGS